MAEQQPDREDQQHAAGGPGMRWLFFGLSGRISRGPYVLGMLFFMALSSAVFSRLMVLPEESGQFAMWSLAFVLLIPVIIWTTIALAVKRLHDINIPGPVSICLFVPAVSLLAMLVLALWPGTRGGNDYGDETNQPKRPRLA
ncbi:MAG: DUF805 domain-containing protein [Alphaproteobacteria bacterium]|nr:DUF805 domain-containing protein [Alphaproteobacteria bacterium]